jgi:FkbM family methyltransferase
MFYAQHKQDEFLEKVVFKGFKNGVYVDVGAHDGLSINNTLYFEKENDWTGINIEPMKKIYDRLVQNRPKSLNINCAVSVENGYSDFIEVDGYPEMISGLVSDYDNRHYYRLDRELAHYGGKKQIVKVKTCRLDTIFQENNVTHVHFLSIDVEGAEFSVIKSIDFDKVFIDVILFENNYSDTSSPILKYLSEKDYRVIKIEHDIFMIHKNSQFINNLKQ